MSYLLIDKRQFGKVKHEPRVKRVTLDEAAKILLVEASHIEWCLEEYNRCDVDLLTVIKEEYDEHHPA